MYLFQKTKENLFLYIKNIIDQKKKNLFIEFFLYGFSFFYRFSIFFKNLIYDLKILKSKKVKSKVISIGNIDCGGTGKTPFIIFLANKLISNNKKIAVITRGYKSRYEKKSLYIDKNSKFDVFDIGDEAFLLKNHIRDLPIFVGRNKLKSAKKASDLNYDIILIDDGFQYRKLKKDLEIIILNAKKPFFENKLLPIGFLREGPKSLKRADFIIVNNADCEDKKLEEIIKNYTNCPIIYTKPYANRFLDFSKNIIKIEKKTKVGVFCGIGNPSLFFNTINELDLDIVNKLELLDHEKISSIKLNEFVKKSLEKKAKFIITTEKDFVKLNYNIKTNLPIIYLEIILNIISNKYNLKSLVEKFYKLFNN